MMASRWVHSCEDDERQRARSSLCENDSPEGQSSADFPAAQHPMEDELFSWPRPKTVRLRRTSQGFGFTLRHFIVYPPESSLHDFPEKEFGHRGRQRNRLEPMDTIFVKQVKEGGPAHGAGLCAGDRIVRVNGASIIGKAYSEVISLIQDSGDFLELCVMPKDEDILQLAYSQDAYLLGHNSYSGNACHIPDPPPVCYPRVDCKPTGMAQVTDSAGQVCRAPAASLDYGYRKEITVPPSPSLPYPKSQTAVCMHNDSVRTVVVPPNTAHIGRMIPAQRIDFMDSTFVKGRPGSLAQYPHPRKADIYPGGPGMVPFGGQVPNFPGNHQNIDWRTYQTYREYIDNKGIHSHGSRTIQERLDNLRTASQASFPNTHHIPRGDWGPKGVRRRSTSHERSYHVPPPHFQIAPRSASQDRMSNAERISHARNWAPRSVSQDGLVLKARARSTDYAEPVELAWPSERRGMYPRSNQGTRPSRQSIPINALPVRPSTGYTGGMRGAPNPFYPKGPDSLQTHSSPKISERHSIFGKSTSAEHSFADQRVPVKGCHSVHTNQQGQGRIRAGSVQPTEASRDSAMVGLRSASCSTPKEMPQRPGILKTGQQDSHSQVNGQSPTETGVVLRDKSHAGKTPSPLRQHSYILAVNDDGADSTAEVVACWLPNDARREMHMRRLEEQRHTSCSSNLDESLDAIPFIDEPVSPSVDREAAPIPPSAVISVAPSIATAPSSQGSPCPPIRRQLSHDQESLRSALLDSDSASKTERSKSYDEGLDDYQEEGRGRSSSKPLPGFRGRRKTLDGQKPSGDSSSRRDSSADVFADSSKEGLLNFRQISTDKNKRVGGGIKSWKQMYAVLQGHTLTLYKDKKDALSQGEEDPLRISIKACLIDISYSETRRKNVLRLTTSDCEYLFQAEGRDDMLKWIKVIQENSNPDEENAAVTSQDLISRKIKEYNMMSAPSSRSEPSPKTSRQSLSIKQAFLGGKTDSKIYSPHSPKPGEERRALKDESSPPRDRGTWKIGIAGIMRKPFEKKTPAGMTFGVRLEDCPPAQTNRFVPLIVEVCCKVVEERGLEYTGIYRVPGNNAAISSMQEELNSKGMTDIDIEEDKWRDLNVISSLLKSFFRKLPEPLFTNQKYADFIEASRTEDSVERLKELKRLIYELPDHHFETLKFLCAHLKRVSDNCEKNKMEPRNLAIVFGPTLVRTSEDNMTNMVNHMPDQCKIVENLIQQFDWFFTEDSNEDPVTATEQESTVQSQPVPNIDHLLSNIGRTAASPGDVSDSACSDSSKSKGLWGSGKDPCSKEMLRSSFFVSRKRKKPKDKAQPSSSDDDLDHFNKKELPEEGQQQPLWSQDSRTEDETQTEASEKEKHRKSSEEELDKSSRKESQPNLSLPPEHISPTLQTASPYASPSHSPNLSYRIPVAHHSSLSDPPSNYDDTVSDLGTMNSTSSRASVPRARPGRVAGLGAETSPSGLGAEVCSITSDYSTTSSMTFLTGAELSTLSPEVQSVSESRGGDDADDERSELISEGRQVETGSESDLSVFTVGKAEPGEPQEALRPLPSHRLIECDTLSRKKSGQLKTNSESSLDGSRGDKDSNRLSQVVGTAKGRSSGSLSSSSRSELDKTELAWRLKITDRLKGRLRMSADDMFGVGSQRSRSPEGRSKKKNIRRRHTMGGQRDFAELSVLGDWSQPVGIGAGSRSELSAVDRLKPKCSSQDFSIGDWIARERHRTSNPEVSLDLSEQPGALSNTNSQNAGASSSSSELTCRPAEAFNGEVSQGKNLSLSATAHPHKLTGAQVVQSRFYQYL